jgi:hypothetical protein
MSACRMLSAHCIRQRQQRMQLQLPFSDTTNRLPRGLRVLLIVSDREESARHATAKVAAQLSSCIFLVL